MPCLACGNDDMKPCLDLGCQPLANDFKLSDSEHEEAWPLAVDLCTSCHHLQLNHFVDPEIIFKNYLYVSGTSDVFRRHMYWFADFTGARAGMRVLDIGCNDGTQLTVFKERGCETWGVDPAENLFPISSSNHKVHLGFFETFSPNIFFDVMCAQNVFAHNRDPLAFLQHAKTMMDTYTKFYIQTSQADMVLNGEFDTIYHEHINFFNVLSFKRLAERAGLALLDVLKTPIHGTSFMFVVGREGEPTSNVQAMIDLETAQGMHTLELYELWAAKARAFAERIRRDLTGKFVVAYGAAAKGNTLLNFVGLRPNMIIDDNPLKQGRFSPGVRSPVVPSSALTTLPDHAVTFVPLAWNFFDEIRMKILAKRDRIDDEFYDLKYIISCI
jgi:SAM-dependent methyltransferase